MINKKHAKPPVLGDMEIGITIRYYEFAKIVCVKQTKNGGLTILASIERKELTYRM